MPTVKETFDNMASRFRAEKAAGVNATIQYDITRGPGRDVERGHQGRRLQCQPGRGGKPEPHAHDVLAGLARHDRRQALRADGLHVRQAQAQGGHGPRHEGGEPVPSLEVGGGPFLTSGNGGPLRASPEPGLRRESRRSNSALALVDRVASHRRRMGVMKDELFTMMGEMPAMSPEMLARMREEANRNLLRMKHFGEMVMNPKEPRVGPTPRQEIFRTNSRGSGGTSPGARSGPRCSSSPTSASAGRTSST